nr:peptidoglycan DD-metalloendopeptidase family protein [uncultured Carboxylicivirga sp.]
MVKMKYSLITILLTLYLGLNAQNIKDLQSQKEKIENELKKSSQMLAVYGKQRSKALTNVRLINSQISSRQRLIDLYASEINWLTEDIADLRLDIEKSEKDLLNLKSEYAHLIQKSYENRKIYNEVTFFLGADSFNEAYRRFIVLKEYNKFRHSQGILIKKRQTELEEKTLLLQTKLKVQNNALNKVLIEKNELMTNKKSLSNSIVKLKQKERQVKIQIKNNQKALDKLEKAIIKLVEEANKEETAFTNFDKAIGKLSWPVQSGIIISQFGEHQHPVLKYVKVKNNGVDIQSNSKNECLAVFEGKVSRIVTIPGYNKTVILRHGNFLTVYANLESVSVKKGDSITKGTIIGNIYSGDGESSNVLHFEIWDGNKKLNPEKWLSN